MLQKYKEKGKGKKIKSAGKVTDVLSVNILNCIKPIDQRS
jgi:hypothetical protein